MSLLKVSFPTFPGGLVLSNEHYGDGLSLSDVEGWWDSVAPRLNDEPRPNADGDFDEDPIYQGARFVTVLGRATFMGEPGRVFEAQRQLMTLHSLPSPFPIEVEDPMGTFTASVVLADRVGFDLHIGPGVAEFEFTVKANDPRKYGVSQTVSTGLPTSGGGVVEPVVEPFSDGVGGDPGRVTLTNTGNADTIPTFMVSGGLSGGFELICIEKGARIRLERLIPDGSVVTVDMASGQAWIDGQSPISGNLTIAEWWRIEPGETVTVQFVGLGVVTGTPTLTAVYASAER